MKKTLLITILSLICGAAAFAGNGVDKAAESGFTLRKHEIAAGGSFLPGSDLGEAIYFPNSDVSQVSYSNSWWLSYTYNFTKLFALQIQLSYDGFTMQQYFHTDTFHNSYITPMILGRFSWLNRRIVRLYSSVGIGVIYRERGWYKGGDVKANHVKCAFQAVPIGISVGKKLYGFAELGAGTVYYVGCAGIGYRF